MQHEKDIVPILLDDTALPEALRPYQWIDFRPVFALAVQAHGAGNEISEIDRSLVKGLTLGAGIGAIAGGLSGGAFGAIVGAGLGAIFGPQAAVWRQIAKKRVVRLDTVTRAVILSTLRERVLH